MKLRHIKRKTCALQRRLLLGRRQKLRGLFEVWKRVRFLSDELPYIRAMR